MPHSEIRAGFRRSARPPSASTGAQVGTHAAAEAARVDFPLRLVAGRARSVAYRAERSASGAMGDGALEKWPVDRARIAAACFAADRSASACAQRRDWSDGARLFALGLVEGEFNIDGGDWTAEIDALAIRRGAGDFVAAGSQQGQNSANRFQPDWNQLHLVVRHAGARRNRARDRRAAHRQGLQRARVRQCAGASGGDWASAGRFRDGRGLRLTRNAAAV